MQNFWTFYMDETSLLQIVLIQIFHVEHTDICWLVRVDALLQPIDAHRTQCDVTEVHIN